MKTGSRYKNNDPENRECLFFTNGDSGFSDGVFGFPLSISVNGEQENDPLARLACSPCAGLTGNRFRHHSRGGSGRFSCVFVLLHRRDGRAVECGGLENRCLPEGGPGVRIPLSPLSSDAGFSLRLNSIFPGNRKKLSGIYFRSGFCGFLQG